MKDECSLVFPEFLKLEPALKRFIASRVNSREVAEDLTNDVALKMYQHCQQIPKVTNLRSWLFTIARNAVIDYFRKAQREVELPESLEISDLAEETTDRSAEQCLQSLIRHLPQKYRKPLLMSDYRGMSQWAVAQKLGLSYTTAKTRISRARTRLKTLFRDRCEEVV